MSHTVVITGANRGIGLALCQVFHERGDTVYGVCRQASNDLTELGVKVIDGVDVTTQGGLDRLKSSLQSTSIDILINNAGIMRPSSLGELDTDGINAQFTTNAVAPLLLTEALINQLADGGKVAMITSRMGSIADNTSGGSYAYRMSKAALNAAGKSLAHDLQSRGVAVALLHPGYVQTDMVGGHGNLTPAEAASGLAQRIDELNLDNSGGFWHSQGEELPW